MADVSFAPTEDLELIRSTTRQFLEDRLGLDVVRGLMMSEHGFDPSLWSEFSAMGWTGLAIPEEYGGAGYGFLELSIVLEEMGRLVTPGPFFSSVVLATSTILELGTAEQLADLLPELASGEKRASLAVYEGARDWELAELKTVAVPQGDEWVISGEKRYVLDGHLADWLLVVARLEDGPGVFVVDASVDGVVISQTPTLDPTRRQAMVSLDQAPSRMLLGDRADRDGLFAALRLGSVGLAAEQVGGAQRVLEMSVDYAKTRHQFGRPIGSYQAVKHRCAEMLVKVEHAKSTAYHAARVSNDREELTVAAPLAASVCSEAYLWAAGESIQIYGGIGFTWEHDAHIYLKRARSSSSLLGDPGYHRARLADALAL